MVLILGFESSCDETAVALVADGCQVLAERVVSQAADFAEWGGVVPELAARAHMAHLPNLVDAVLHEAGKTAADIDAIATTAWPGLIGSLVVGLTCAKMLAARWDCPLIAVDHIQAHLCAIHLGRDEVPYPLVGLVASGGHSHFYHVSQQGAGTCLGGTIDDAAGEAFDKAAAILGLGYPGGPRIDALAQQGDAKRFALPRSFLHEDSLRLSFAGLKTALLYQVRGPMGKDPLTLDEQGIADACASFQAAVCDVLVAKLERAALQHQVATIAIGGGVACNSGLRTALTQCAEHHGWELYMPAPAHCADNAAMVASLGYFQFQRQEYADLSLRPLPTGRAGPRAAVQ